MDLPRNFKFDVRIRSRLLAKGVLTEAEVGKYLEGLEDRHAASHSVELAQPALINPEDRPTPPASASVPSHPVEPRPVSPAPSERSAPRSIAPGPLAVDEGWDEDDEDLDDEDEEDEETVTGKAAAPKPAEPEAARKAEPIVERAVDADDDSELAGHEALEDADDEDSEDDEDGARGEEE